MIIKPSRKYVVVCKGPDELIYRWLLNVEPGFKAWSVVDENIEVGEIFKGHSILSINDVTNTTFEEKFNKLNLRGNNKAEINLNSIKAILNYNIKDFEFWDYPIPVEEYDFEGGTSDLGSV